MRTGRVTGGALIALMLAGCTGGSVGGSTTSMPDTDMSGRWILSAPNAPICGLNFAGMAGAREGPVAPEGGCAEKFFMSRRWTLDQGALVINDADNQALANLRYAGGRFEGRSAAGTTVTLTRYTPPG